METKINNAFANLEDVFAAHTFNSFANSLPQPSISGAGGNSLTGQAGRNGYHQNASQCNYVHSKAKSHFKNSTALTAVFSSASTDSSQSIGTAVTNNWGSHNLSTSFTGASASPSALFDTGIVDLLNACQELIDFILQALEDVGDAVLEGAAAALTSLSEGWNASIEIPVISWLWTHVITDGDQLTLLDLLALILAVPTTILFDLIEGQAPFTAEEANAITSSTIPWPAFPTSGDAPTAAEPGSCSPAFIYKMNSCGMFAELINSLIFETGLDLLAADVPPAPEAWKLKKFLSVVSLILTAVKQVGGAPWAIFSKPRASWTAADDWTVGLWVGSCVPLVYNSVFTYESDAVARCTLPPGPILDTCTGVALLGLGVVTLLEQHNQGSPYSKWDLANCIVPHIGRMFKYISLAPELLDVLLVVDIVLGVGSAVTEMGAAYVAYEGS